MKEAKHTKEPWLAREDMLEIEASVGSGKRALIAGCFEGDTYRISAAEAKENLHRIVACINGCEGTNPEAVSDLLAACEAIIRYDNSGGREPFREAANLAREAIAKATGN